VLALVGLAAAGCQRELEGAPCPCVDGYVCDDATSVCRRDDGDADATVVDANVDDAGATPDADTSGLPDASPPGDPDASP
jgi:hypothetical protein